MILVVNINIEEDPRNNGDDNDDGKDNDNDIVDKRTYIKALLFPRPSERRLESASRARTPLAEGPSRRERSRRICVNTLPERNKVG